MKTFTFYSDGFGWSYRHDDEAYVKCGYAIIDGEWVYGILVYDAMGNPYYFRPEYRSCIRCGLLNRDEEIVTVVDIIYSPFFA